MSVSPLGWGCMSVGVYIGIVYIMPTIGGICVCWWMSLGPSGQGWGHLCELVFSHWYCIYHANNSGDVSQDKIYFGIN